jgi:hypothetical protein
MLVGLLDLVAADCIREAPWLAAQERAVRDFPRRELDLTRDG